MKALVCEGYGGVGNCAIRDVPNPEVGDDQVLIRVLAASVNRSDWEGVTGKPAYSRSGPGGLRGKPRILGTDAAGVVEKVGPSVTRFKAGDEVYGDLMYHGGGTFAEYAVARENAPMTVVPEGVTIEEAAALPQSGVIAIQALRAKGGLTGGQSVLVNGGGGGTGLMLIQMAKRLGCRVTGVDNSRKLDVMKRAGADHVIDYAADDYSRQGERYDRIIDLVASRSPFVNRRALSGSGVYLVVGGPVRRLLSVLTAGQLMSAFRQRHIGMLMVRPNVADLEQVARDVAGNYLDPMIERTYKLDESPDALERLGTDEALGKLVITSTS